MAPQAEAQTTVTLVSNTGKTAVAATTISSSRQFRPGFRYGQQCGRIQPRQHCCEYERANRERHVDGHREGGRFRQPEQYRAVHVDQPDTWARAQRIQRAGECHAGCRAKTYHVVLAFSESTGGPRWVRTAISNGLDAGASPGWDIDAGGTTLTTALATWSVVSSSQSFQLQVKGSLPDTTAPRVTSIERNTPTTTPTNADTLTWRVTFNEDVKDVGDADFAIAGTTETLTLSATAVTGSASLRRDGERRRPGRPGRHGDAVLRERPGHPGHREQQPDGHRADGDERQHVRGGQHGPDGGEDRARYPTTSPTNANGLARRKVGSFSVTFSEADPVLRPARTLRNVNTDERSGGQHRPDGGPRSSAITSPTNGSLATFSEALHFTSPGPGKMILW